MADDETTRSKKILKAKNKITMTSSDDNLDDDDDRDNGSVHFGDSEFDVDEDFGDATWEEVCRSCCCHTKEEWYWIALAISVIIFLLYFFMFGLDLLSSGAKVMSGCRAGALFGDDTNPIAGLMIGILATVLLQSSSTTTSIIVSLVGDSISVSQGIYMIMGANIGTSVTNTIVALGQMGDGDQLERAFAGATVHDMFNFLTVAVLLPLEVFTGYLEHFTAAMVRNSKVREGDEWEGPITRIVSPLARRVIIPNKSVIKAVANEGASCSSFYPNKCEGKPTFHSCGGHFGLIGCDEDSNKCPAFFTEDATENDDKVSGGVVFIIAILTLFTCLLGIVAILQRMLLGMSTRIVYKATDVNGYVAIVLGMGITMLVQSSSITTSTLTPLVGLGILRLEQMYPLTLGANIGTTLTGITAAMVAHTIDALQVALAHLVFNVTGILLFYPIPFLRRIPLHAARKLGRATRIWRGFPLFYIFFMFVIVPLLFLALSALFEKDSVGFKVLGSFFVIIIVFVVAYIIYWCLYLGGRKQCADCMAQREVYRVAYKELPTDMRYLKERVALISEQLGLPTEVEDEDDDDDDDDVYTAAVEQAPGVRRPPYQHRQDEERTIDDHSCPKEISMEQQSNLTSL